GRTREYIDIVRTARRREKVAYDGAHFQLPLPDGPGKALRLTVHPVRDEVPVYLAAIGPKNIELTGEIADGWLPVFFSPEHSAEQDRKSTRLNSSHVKISYAVFCLKKKKKERRLELQTSTTVEPEKMPYA